MIAFISGIIEEILSDSVIVSSNDIGYEIGFVQQDRIKIGEKVKIFTYLNVREDALTLFGFLTKTDLTLFQRLISVKGIGPKGAMNALSKTTGLRLIQAIEDGDVNYLKSLPGVGPKSASQIVLDLKGKLVDTTQNKYQSNEALSEALTGLKNFGYKQSELNLVEKELSKKDDLSVDEYIKAGLQYLTKLR